MKVIDWWSDNDKFGSKKNLNVILDNCPYHKSKKAIEYLKTLKLKLYFLPPYSPSLAPIELMFGWIKKKDQLEIRLTLIQRNTCSIF